MVIDFPLSARHPLPYFQLSDPVRVTPLSHSKEKSTHSVKNKRAYARLTVHTPKSHLKGKQIIARYLSKWKRSLTKIKKLKKKIKKLNLYVDKI